jgi:hypothetical protein
MKPSRLVRTVLAPLVFSSVLSLAGCASTFTMVPDASVPFSKGEVSASFKDNGNGHMVVKVEHLGDPKKISSSATTYVVWVKPSKEGAEPINVGALKVGSDEAGELEFTTPYRSFELSITPEAAADAAKPTGKELLKTGVSG